MNYYVDFDPYLIRQRNEQMLKEVYTLRLQERLRPNRTARGSQLLAFARRGALSLLRRAGFAS